jgi:hypothetical protein
VEELRKKIEDLLLIVDQTIVTLDIPQKHERLDLFRTQTEDVHFWQKTEAANIVKEISNLELQINDWEELKKNLFDLQVICTDDQAGDLAEVFEKDSQLLQETFYLYFQAYLKDVNHSQFSSTIDENIFL